MSTHRLNPHAGDVPMPSDPREIDAALLAGRITQRVFPYYRWRYGDRGRAFTRSDSAWLAWLAGCDQPTVDEKILWLRAVLSNRGMPGRLLEFHLQVMHRVLVRRVPTRAGVHGRLSVAARRLESERLGAIPAGTAAALVDDFVAGFADGPPRLVRGTGQLVVAAVADERLGNKKAVSSLTRWLADVGRLRAVDELVASLTPAQRRALASEAFADRWSSALETTIAGARKA